MSSSLAVEDFLNVKALVAVVTGGATGIDLMYVMALEKNGSTVYIVGRRKKKLDKVAREEAVRTPLM